MLSPLFSEVQLSAFLLTLGSKYIIIILFFQDCYYRITLSKSIFCHFFFYFAENNRRCRAYQRCCDSRSGDGRGIAASVLTARVFFTPVRFVRSIHFPPFHHRHCAPRFGFARRRSQALSSTRMLLYRACSPA